jgi:hypothetical protein
VGGCLDRFGSGVGVRDLFTGDNGSIWNARDTGGLFGAILGVINGFVLENAGAVFLGRGTPTDCELGAV